MKLSGTATIGHPVRDVYAALTDPAVLVRTLPGCQRLEQVGPDSYDATLAAGVGSIKGLFDGHVRLTEAPGFGIEVNEEALRRYEHTKSAIGVFER